ncbi:uncharacterized protein LOC131329669 isoform X3 [Rhododendron vialii]|uniref:uncharacterized protein LOC131329669 isoform X3 n=1 Tax=Rhododendron vialii TaxID=182163 RepID=UPI00265DDF4F|nr:uncharacterized protein LOC131329669 isoform X3 [Rhododendron vialii]
MGGFSTGSPLNQPVTMDEPMIDTELNELRNDEERVVQLEGNLLELNEYPTDSVHIHEGTEFPECGQKKDDSVTNELDPFIGQRFRSEEEAFICYRQYAYRNGFSVRKDRSFVKNEEVRRRDFCCQREGKPPVKLFDPSKEQRNRKSVKCGCKARMRITLRKSGDMFPQEWHVTEFVKEHNHERLTPTGVRFLPEIRKNTKEDEDGFLLLEGLSEDSVSNEFDPFIGQCFLSEEEAFICYKQYASRNGFSIRKDRTFKKNEELRRRDFCCQCHGKRPLKLLDPSKGQRNRKSIKCGCRARMRITWRKSFDIFPQEWQITEFVKEHTHDLLTPTEVWFPPVNQKIKEEDEARILSLKEEGHSVGQIVRVMQLEKYLNHDYLPFFEKDVCDLVTRIKGKDGVNDATDLLKHCEAAKAENCEFRYAFTIDEERKLEHLFWSPAHSFDWYQKCGDVVVFDTTHKINAYEMPFGIFVGVNNNGKTILFGCALLRNKTTSAFQWLMKTFVSLMKKQPKTILTDQDPRMTEAIAKEFSSTKHSFCIWHITSKFSGWFMGVLRRNYPCWCADFDKLYHLDTPEEFEYQWSRVVTKYNLHSNKHVAGLYEIKHFWVPAYLRDHFFGGMITTGRSESINAFIKRFTSSHTNLEQFVRQNNACLNARDELQNAALCPAETVLYTSTVVKVLLQLWCCVKVILDLFILAFDSYKGFIIQDPSALEHTVQNDSCINGRDELQNAALGPASKKLEEDLQMQGLKLKWHENNIKNFESQICRLEASIRDMQVSLGTYESSSAPLMEAEDYTRMESEEETVDHIIKHEKSAAGILCSLKSSHGSQASHLLLTKDVLGIVAQLGKVDDDNLSRLLAEYLGIETMLAIVCKTCDSVKGLETYEKDGSITKSSGIHGLGISIGRKLDGRFLVICLENLRPYSGEFICDDPQHRLDLLKPRLPNGEPPPGFLGFAVNMINIDNDNLFCVTANGHGLREILFYNLFSGLQVYRTRTDMLHALPCIRSGAISLDGGIIKTTGMFSLGNRENIAVKFPKSCGTSNLRANYFETARRITEMKWDKERRLEDMQRERVLLDHTRYNFDIKKKELLKFIAGSSSYVTQHQIQARRLTPT